MHRDEELSLRDPLYDLDDLLDHSTTTTASTANAATAATSASSISSSMSIRDQHRHRIHTTSTRSQQSQRRRRAIVWFRRDLRLHDNLSLRAALDEAQEHSMAIIPIYIIHNPVKKKCGAARFQFLLECIQDLANSLRERDSQLLVLRGDAIEVFKVLLPAWGITDLYFEELVMPYAIERDHEIQVLAKQLHVRVTSVQGATLFDSKQILARNNGVLPLDFSQFLKIVSELPQPSMPIATPKHVDGFQISVTQLFALLEAYCRSFLSEAVDQYVGSREHPFELPQLHEFGLTPPDPHSFLYGGETRALAALEAFCADDERVGRFEKPKTSPVSIDKPSTTGLSAHLTFGCLSVREFFYRVMFIQLNFTGLKGAPETTLDGQLMWREFFYCFSANVEHFDTQDQNPMCSKIPWRLHVMPAPDAEYISDDARTAMEHLQCWKEGRTGFPWIDATMRQINQEGWAHHLGRHAVACFLTRGDLYISWLHGAHYFQEKLIDLDWPLNIGNWLWVSSSCFFRDYRVVHSPSLFAQPWDPKGLFIRKFIPELRKMPTRYIYEPWRAPLRVQRAANCLIGKHYPFPIVDHQAAMRRSITCLDRYHGLLPPSAPPYVYDEANSAPHASTTSSSTASTAASSSAPG